MRRVALRKAARDFALGAGLALGQAPLGLWPVAVVALALGLARIAAAAGPGAAFGRALLFGAGHFTLALSWIVQPFFVDPVRHGWMAPFALLGMGFGMALFWAVAAWGAARLRAGIIGLALAIALMELARGHVLTGFPWALVGHIWLDSPLIQTGALIGGYGMTAATLLGAALAMRPGWRGRAVTVALAIVAAGWSWHRLSLPEPPAPGGVVRLVQPAIAQDLKWDRDRARDNFETLLALSQGEGPVDLVIWPETAVPYLTEPGGPAAQAIAAATGLPVAAGLQREDGQRAWNSLVLIGPGGSFDRVYDKIHLVPFGEYIPFGDLAYDLFGLTAFAAQAGAVYSAGDAAALIDFGPGLGPARVLICYEAIFPEEIATATRPGWLLQVTNDAWFGTLTGPYQHFALTRLRAVEQGLPLVRVANTGVSAVIDARGRIMTGPDGAPLLLPLGLRGALDAALPGRLSAPPYARIGDIPLFLMLLAGLALSAWSGLRRDRA
jgi:apolipoprotein N-acyltransferase